MRTVRRLFYADIVSSVAFVALAFLSLFFFIDFVDEISDTRRQGYTLFKAFTVSVLQLPGHVYELMPIAVLIGTIYALARLAQSSEYTILRTGGLGPGRALSLLASLGVIFAVVTFLVGDYVAPFAEQEAATVQAQFKGGLKLGRTGAWLRDHQTTPQGERSYAINVGSAASGGLLHNVRIFEFDGDGRLLQRIAAARAQVDKDALWTLSDVTITHWPRTGAGASGAAASAPAVTLPDEFLPVMQWHSSLSANVVASSVLPLSTMSTMELARYIAHLSSNEQAAQEYEIQFWKRALYPFACLVMVGLALPFAYMQARAGGISLKVFGGIMLGISFVLLNNVASHLGMLRDWTPWMVAAAPSIIYLMLSMAAFAWLVKYR